ncbi:PREDICTED: probable inactive receptor kinase At5g10020 [Tarenaya hassleriana]|uniref:probable inactive receptor kinase At5g10020 n=1 Tax=Tarenaya hassleriana TaxID=28532 RepID=UPI00053C5B65|nr:PREDICTED: probable inactive receptor kinase At5g10020 [Tarenaya hassleriana]
MHTICSLVLLLVVSVSGFSDFEALLELKKGIQEDPSGRVLPSWDSEALSSDGCPKNWHGISCIGGYVTSIDLNGLGLVGNFRFSAIVGLRMMENITISKNQFSGTISNIGLFKSLKYLDLSCNVFRGSVPSGIENSRSLKFLNLSSNNFGGEIPSGFGNLDKLEYLDLHGNSFSGDVMNLFSQLVTVAYVDISRNKFSGSLDLALGRSSFVSSVRYLNVSGNSLAGQLFAHDGIPFFDSLEVFDASSNQLSGSVPLFSFVVSLKILRLQGNHFSGTLPQGLVQESSMVLSELDLSLNQLEGPVGSITSGTLEKLNLSSNKLSGSLPLKVGHCAIIDLSDNKISGSLARIESWGNYVEVIRLSSNSLSGSLPNQTSQFLRLTSFEAANNSLQGVLPFILGTYPEIKTIDLSHNQLSGFLPGNIFTSAKLTDLKLSSNNFTGTLPLQDARRVGNLSLTAIDLSHNTLGGVIPEELSQFRNLVSLDLSDNEFEGNIPDDLPDNLEVLNVSANNLSGIVPENLRRFPESAYHPGNTLLIIPNSPSTPKDAADITLRKHMPHMKPSTKVGLIVGLVAGTVGLAFVCLLVHHVVKKKHKEEEEKMEGIEGKKSGPKAESSLSHASTPKTKAEPPVSSPCFSQDRDSGTSSAVSQVPNDPKLTRKDEISSSPMSLVTSVTPSPSRIQSSPENPRSCQSPVKLAGDLYVFDSSLVFTPEELSCAPAEAMGRSCHGILYRAMLNSNCVLAVKWLREGIAKSKKDFAREIKKLGNIKHPNLVSLQAYYWGPKKHEKLLISTFIDAPSLAHYLQETRPGNLPPLSLDNRLKIAQDIARCLSYLHNERAIPHGNLKSTNVLLQPSPELTARLTDYSLHRIITPAATAEQVLNAAALGYRPPEFASSSKPFPSLKSDVYAFGVILLELLTGKSSGEIVSSDPGVVELTDWVLKLVGQNRTVQCFDQTLLETPDSSYLPRVLIEMLQVALSCILPAPERPDMKTVFEELSSILPHM